MDHIQTDISHSIIIWSMCTVIQWFKFEFIRIKHFLVKNHHSWVIVSSVFLVIHLAEELGLKLWG